MGLMKTLYTKRHEPKGGDPVIAEVIGLKLDWLRMVKAEKKEQPKGR